jgi:hypothetical protein
MLVDSAAGELNSKNCDNIKEKMQKRRGALGANRSALVSPAWIIGKSAKHRACILTLLIFADFGPPQETFRH